MNLERSYSSNDFVQIVKPWFHSIQLTHVEHIATFIKTIHEGHKHIVF